MFSLTKILNRLYLTKFSFYLLLALIIISFSITFYLMLPNNNLVKNPLQLQYFLLADVFFCYFAFGSYNQAVDIDNNI